MEILCLYDTKQEGAKPQFIQALHHELIKHDLQVQATHALSEAVNILEENPKIMAFLFDWDHFDLNLLTRVSEFTDNLPIFAFTNQHSPLDINLAELQLNMDFLQYDKGLVHDDTSRIIQAIKAYHQSLLPPFTKALMRYVTEGKYTFCTPGHLGGSAFQVSTPGALFYDFLGSNIFKADISISIAELGSLLDHSGPHREAENFTAEIFGAERTLFVTNGTSTANKIVGMYATKDGDTILVDRNCHKSITHFMMMNNVKPVYLKPTRNAYGILGGIPLKEFERVTAELKETPSYAVITNSTYDGLFYNVQEIGRLLTKIPVLHFDSAWVPYTAFHPIYQGKFGLSLTPQAKQTIFETQSTHKLLAAFSQASMIHAKGHFDNEVLNENYMMHTSTSPFYPMVASCEISAAMMQGKRGKRLMAKTLERAYQFRQEVKRLKNTVKDWYYDVWQPAKLDEIACWELKPHDTWHGFQHQEANHLFLDPLKITLLLPGLKDGSFERKGIPASIVSQYLDHHGIIVEKTGPYSMLFLFSIGITQAKAMRLLTVLNHFKQDFDRNLFVKEMLPHLYAEHPEFYESMRIQDLAQNMHELMVKHDLPNLMYRAFDVLPEIAMTPHEANQELLRFNTKKIRIQDMMNKISAVMILPYPPGIPLIMPGEKVTEAAKDVLDYLLLLQDIGRAFPGFAADIHGLTQDAEGFLLAKVIQD